MKRILFGLAVAFVVLAGFSKTAAADIEKFQQIDKYVYRGDQPDNLADYETLARLGIKTIINLRNDDSIILEVPLARKVGIRVLHFPMSTFTWPSDETVLGILTALTDPSLQPVFVHCQYGKDRTGIISALYRVHVQGWTRAAASQEMYDFGFSPFLANFRAYLWASTFGYN